MKTLSELRKEIRDIDEKMIELIKERFDIANKIGEIKKNNGLPLKNWELEKDIIGRTKKRAEQFGISEKFMVNIMREIIKESCMLQEISHYMKFKGEKENIFIIGASGKMGKWFSEFFQIKGHNILKYDINPDSNENGWTDFKRGLKNSSITLIATPIKTIPMILEKIIDFKYKGIVFDIASIKTYLIDSYKKALKQGLSITSIHPLFGPDTKILSDKIMCFCDIGDKSSNLKIQSLFKDTAISVFKTSIEQHDLLISYVLNLSHLINIIYVNLLSESGFDYKTLKAMGSTTFFSQIKTSKSVISEEPNLYFDIQILNKYSDEILGNFDNISDKIIKIIKDDNLSEFKKIMEKGKKWIQG